MFYLLSFRYNYNVITCCVVKMEDENFNDSCQISDVENDFDFNLLGDDYSKVLLENDSGTDSDDSDVIVVRKKKKNWNYWIWFRGQKYTTYRQQCMEWYYGKRHSFGKKSIFQQEIKYKGHKFSTSKNH